MTFIKKIHFAVAVLLISSIGNAYGNNDSLNCNESSLCNPCQPSCCVRGFISADLLYWRAFESGLDDCYAIEFCDDVSSGGTVVSRFKGKGRNPHFNWDPGFRIGAGVSLENSQWALAAFWTHFHSHAHSSHNPGHKLKWKLDLDIVDLVLAYDYDLNTCAHLRPFIGLRWANIDQNLHLNSGRHSFSSTSSCSSTSSWDSQFTNNRKKQDFFGVGPLIGLEADWAMGCGFSFYINGAFSWLYGKFKVKLHDSNVYSDIISYCSVSKHLDANVAAADAGLGIRWQTCLCKNMQLLLQLGLEHHRYYDFNRIRNCGDLSFDGVNFSAAVEF